MRARHAVVILLCAGTFTWLVGTGCDLIIVPPGGEPGRAPVMIFFEGRDIDGFAGAFVDVTNVEFLGDNDARVDDFDLDPPVRIDLLDEEFGNFVACLEEAPTGTYNKLRLTIADPQLVLEDGTVIEAEDVQLNANGQLDFNTQGDAFTVAEDENNVVIFRMSGDDNAWQITETGSDKFIPRVELFVTTSTALEGELLVRSGEIVTVDLPDGNGNDNVDNENDNVADNENDNAIDSENDNEADNANDNVGDNENLNDNEADNENDNEDLDNENDNEDLDNENDNEDLDNENDNLGDNENENENDNVPPAEEATIVLALSNCDRTVAVGEDVIIIDVNGDPAELDVLVVGAIVQIEGTLADDNETIIAGTIIVLEE